MNKPVRLMVLGLAGTLVLAGCHSGRKPEGAETDAALNGSLGDQITVDPGMAGGQVTLPPQERSPEAVKAAQADAADVAGGTLTPAPQPAGGAAAALTETAATAAQVGQAAKVGHTDCAGKVAYSKTWAARLPAEMPIYPRASVQEAAGTDGGGCALRVVSYATPVSPQDIMSFYYTMANKAGYGAEYRLDGADHVIGGRKGGRAYVVYARKLGSGVTEVDLVTSGK